MTTALMLLSAPRAPMPKPSSPMQVAGPPSVTGVWQSDDGRTRIELFETGGTYAGRLLWGQRAMEADGRTFKRDVHNPDPRLRSRSLEGITILQNLKWDARERRWKGGDFYDGTSGRSLSAHMRLVNGKLEMRGYMGTPMLGRTLTFHRVTT
ncbi:DUF2147 domain-containing protein [Sphingomonas sp. Y38-1Y]|uniref:DUF2147 domain-containing protein n=1 Tax=Sphingomonas sp. Y38-1Y TaxID=3078265 RepID=UPI0028EDCF3F|nr:DUF2147 domain-containing protein [Sphingomonas sp. Y38-1Y]